MHSKRIYAANISTWWLQTFIPRVQHYMHDCKFMSTSQVFVYLKLNIWGSVRICTYAWEFKFVGVAIWI